MKSFRLEKMSRSAVQKAFITTAILGIFFHGLWLAAGISGLVLLWMVVRKKEEI